MKPIISLYLLSSIPFISDGRILVFVIVTAVILMPLPKAGKVAKAKGWVL